MLEAIKLVGAIAGLLTARFVIWDRWARGRPLAWVTGKKLGVNPYEYVRIKNPGPADVFILGVTGPVDVGFFDARSGRPFDNTSWLPPAGFNQLISRHAPTDF